MCIRDRFIGTVNPVLLIPAGIGLLAVYGVVQTVIAVLKNNDRGTKIFAIIAAVALAMLPTNAWAATAEQILNIVSVLIVLALVPVVFAGAQYVDRFNDFAQKWLKYRRDVRSVWKRFNELKGKDLTDENIKETVDEPVSYTHLDVYKRQCHSSRFGLSRC